jgi:hypothetical protein
MYDIVVDAYCRLVRWEIWSLQIVSAIILNLKRRYWGDEEVRSHLSATHNLYYLVP